MQKIRGFTLIEILVVVSIIGLLASIVVVALKGRREEAGLAGAKQFAQTMYNAIGTDLVALWRFEDAIGSPTAVDFSGYKNTGTLTNGPNFRDASTCGLGFGGCIDFDGVNDYVNIVSSNSVSVNGDLTLSAWIYPTTLSGRRTIIFKHYNNEYELLVENGGTLNFYHGDGAFESVGSSMVVTQNAWNYVAVTRKMADKTLTYYLNGKSSGPIAFLKTPTKSANPVLIGSRLGTDLFFGGKIDEVAIYAKTLTSYEVQQLYVQGLPRHEFASE